MLRPMSAQRHVRTLEEIARDLDLVVFRLERALPEEAEKADAERKRVRRELESVRDRLQDVVRAIDT